MSDPLDQPDEERYEMLYPFVACASQGGPYEDDAFVAGVQLGRIDQALTVAETIGSKRLAFTVRTDLVKQLELVAMARGFPIIRAEPVDETEDHEAMPEWSFITFEQGV
jgi:hypothetical protein